MLIITQGVANMQVSDQDTPDITVKGYFITKYCISYTFTYLLIENFSSGACENRAGTDIVKRHNKPEFS